MMVDKGGMKKEDMEEYLRTYKTLVAAGLVLMLGACTHVAVQKQ